MALALRFLLLALCCVVLASDCASSTLDHEMPSPFYRVLCYSNGQSMMNGQDVVILQNLLIRSPYVNASLTINGEFDQSTSIAVGAFQEGNNLNSDSIFGPDTATALLNLHACDGYKDQGKPASHYGSQYLYKFHFQVFRNRSLETIANLYDANNTLVHEFRIRTHGWDYASSNPPWPYWSNTIGLNMFTSNGNTPTGLAEADLNSPEPNPTSYGPFPVNRMINGLEGNAKFLLDYSTPVRSGILLHTGEWRMNSDWTADMDMPNSEGCIHAHQFDIEQVWKVLVGLGVKVHENPGGQIPYPYPAQGLFSVEQVRGGSPNLKTTEMKRSNLFVTPSREYARRVGRKRSGKFTFATGIMGGLMFGLWVGILFTTIGNYWTFNYEDKAKLSHQENSNRVKGKEEKEATKHN